jgi:hypothetical protein
MDPIIAGSLVSLGKNFIEGVTNSLTPDPEIKPIGKNAFSRELNKVSPTDSVEKVTMDTKALHDSLLENPQVSSFVERNKDCQIFLEKRADGSVQFLSSSGETLVLPKESKTCANALSYFDQCVEEEKNLTSLRPGAVIFDS